MFGEDLSILGTVSEEGHNFFGTGLNEPVILSPPPKKKKNERPVALLGFQIYKTWAMLRICIGVSYKSETITEQDSFIQGNILTLWWGKSMLDDVQIRDSDDS